jgi:hypothetical protein
MLPNSNVMGISLDGDMMQQLFIIGIMVNEAVIDPMAINPFGLSGPMVDTDGDGIPDSPDGARGQGDGRKRGTMEGDGAFDFTGINPGEKPDFSRCMNGDQLNLDCAEAVAATHFDATHTNQGYDQARRGQCADGGYCDCSSYAAAKEAYVSAQVEKAAGQAIYDPKKRGAFGGTSRAQVSGAVANGVPADQQNLAGTGVTTNLDSHCSGQYCTAYIARNGHSYTYTGTGGYLGIPNNLSESGNINGSGSRAAKAGISTAKGGGRWAGKTSLSTHTVIDTRAYADIERDADKHATYITYHSDLRGANVGPTVTVKPQPQAQPQPQPQPQPQK